MTGTRTHVEKVMHSIYECAGWSDLEKRLLDSGILENKVSDRKKFVEDISKIYYNNHIHTEDIISGLPGSVSYYKGHNIFIHGMVHDTPVYSFPENLKNQVKTELEGKDVLYEDGYVSWVQGMSFEERKGLGLGRDSMIHIGYDLLKKFLTSKKQYKYMNNDNGYKNNNNKYMNNDDSSRSITDCSYPVDKLENLERYHDFRKELFRRYLPGSLNISQQTYEMYGKDIDDMTFDTIPTFTKRIIYESIQTDSHIRSMDDIEANNHKDIHILVGAAHEIPLKYLFDNLHIIHKFKFNKFKIQ